MKVFFYKAIFAFLCKLMRIKKRIMFSSFIFSQYSDSPRAICEKMHELYPEFELVWLFKDEKMLDSTFVPDYVVRKKYSHLRFLCVLASSFCVVSNYEYDGLYLKRKGQYFIQTYHGDRGVKKILYEYKAYDGSVKDEFITDLAVAASDFGERKYRSAMHYSGRILTVGCPRNDCLINKDKDEFKIKERIGIPAESKILLYAPTFRKHQGDKLQNNLDFARILTILGKEYYVLVRTHMLTNGIDIAFNERVIDASEYPDMADLLYVSDILITDYSSCAFDFALTDRPFVLFLPDYEEYCQTYRDLDVNPSEIGCLLAHNEDELIFVLENTSREQFKAAAKRSLEFYGAHENGNSAREICDMIFKEFQRNFGRG